MYLCVGVCVLCAGTRGTVHLWRSEDNSGIDSFFPHLNQEDVTRVDKLGG